MNWVFPMAGRGTRTSSLGEFKPFIEIRGKRMLGWLLACLKDRIHASDTLSFVTTSYFEQVYGATAGIEEILSDLEISGRTEVILCEETPQGPADSVYRARHMFDNDAPVIVVNTDQVVDFDMPEGLAPCSGFLPIYAEFTQKSSYVRIEDGRIVELVEKRNISGLSTCGVYAVSSGHALLTALERQFQSGTTVKGEFYVAPALNYLVADGFRLTPITARAKFDLGSPDGIFRFCRFCDALGVREPVRARALCAW